MSQQTKFQISAEQLLNGDFDKIVFFYDGDVTWNGYSSNTQVSHDPDYLCEFTRVQHYDWSVDSLAERMEKVVNETIEDNDKLNQAAYNMV